MLPPNTHTLSGLYPCYNKVEAFLLSIGIVFDPIWIFHSKSIFRFSSPYLSIGLYYRALLNQE